MGTIDDRSVFFYEDEARAVLSAVEEAEKRKRIGARSGLGDAGRGIHLVRIDAAQCHLQAEWLALAASRLRHRLGIRDGGPTDG